MLSTTDFEKLLSLYNSIEAGGLITYFFEYMVYDMSKYDWEKIVD
ncbi:hypothetical protein LPYR103PRE_05480 [Segatella asaccharophila]